MFTIPYRRCTAGLMAAAGVLALPAAGLAQAETYPLAGRSVAVYNLAGEVTITAGSGSDVVVTVSRRGSDGDRLEVRSGLLEARGDGRDEIETLRIIYPSDRIHYDGIRGRTTLQVRDDGTFWGGRGGRRVEISDRGDGLDASANLDIAVPDGKRVMVALGVGTLEARNVDGDLYLDTGSGRILTSGTTGVLNLDTGSGNVTVDGADGEVNIDTGSGDVDAREVRGRDLNIDTGSGNVTVDGADTPEIGIDTGSGDVTLLGARTGSVGIDTGSGDVTVETVAGSASIDVDTGSGDVVVSVPDGYAGEVRIETSSGDLRTEVPLTLLSKEDDEVVGRIGQGGAARIEVETGSGSVSLRRT